MNNKKKYSKRILEIAFPYNDADFEDKLESIVAKHKIKQQFDITNNGVTFLFTKPLDAEFEKFENEVGRILKKEMNLNKYPEMEFLGRHGNIWKYHFAIR